MEFSMSATVGCPHERASPHFQSLRWGGNVEKETLFIKTDKRGEGPT